MICLNWEVIRILWFVCKRSLRLCQSRFETCLMEPFTTTIWMRRFKFHDVSTRASLTFLQVIPRARYVFRKHMTNKLHWLFNVPQSILAIVVGEKILFNPPFHVSRQPNWETSRKPESQIADAFCFIFSSGKHSLRGRQASHRQFLPSPLLPTSPANVRRLKRSIIDGIDGEDVQKEASNAPQAMRKRLVLRPLQPRMGRNRWGSPFYVHHLPAPNLAYVSRPRRKMLIAADNRPTMIHDEILEGTGNSYYRGKSWS